VRPGLGLRIQPPWGCGTSRACELGHGRRRWILHGIDGTLVFVQGDDRRQTLIALDDDGQVVVGVAIVPGGCAAAG
jgi:3'-phosphoadenosine 5'-phosphosulfate (PAPS) 3'-phosphatase